MKEVFRVSRAQAFRGAISLILICAISLGGVCMPFLRDCPFQVQALGAGKTLTLNQAQKLALSRDRDTKKAKGQIVTQQTKYLDAVESIKKRKHTLNSFRWTPLLSFKFPQSPKMDDEYTWTYKPTQITSQITSLKHKLNDCVFSSKLKVSEIYTDIYAGQIKIGFLNGLITDYERDKERTEAAISSGTGTQADLRKIDQALSKYRSELTKVDREFLTNKQKLTKLIGMDVTEGYRFTNPFIMASIPRSALDTLIKVAKENDQSLYEAKLNRVLALTSLKTYQQLMNNKYGGRMGAVNHFVNQAMNGQEIDMGAFQSAMNGLISDVDEKWLGERSILFWTFTLEWFMGDTDGSRYMDNDPYALATAAGDYLDALDEEKSVEEDLETNVRSEFENIVTGYNAYKDTYNSNVALFEEIQADKLRNLAGTFTLEELKEEQNALNSASIDEMELLSSYSKSLYAFDRLTCGGITQYLASASDSMKSSAGGVSYKTPGTEDENDGGDDSGYATSEDAEISSDFMTDSNGGDSYLEADKIDGAYYYIESRVEDNQFVFGVNIPDDATPKITHFELWVNDTMVGHRTRVGEQIIHLALSLDNADKTVVKVYNGRNLVDNVQIDPSVNRDRLDITTAYHVVRAESPRVVGNYTITMDPSLAQVEFGFSGRTGEKIAKYLITDESGAALNEGEPIDIEKTCKHLSSTAGNLSKLKVNFYDSAGNMLYTARFRANDGSMVVYPE